MAFYAVDARLPPMDRAERVTFRSMLPLPLQGVIMRRTFRFRKIHFKANIDASSLGSGNIVQKQDPEPSDERRPPVPLFSGVVMRLQAQIGFQSRSCDAL